MHTFENVDVAEISETRKLRARGLFDKAIHERGTGNTRYAVYALGEAICEDPAQRKYAKELLVTLTSSAMVKTGLFTAVLKRLQLSHAMRQAANESRWEDLLKNTTQLAALRPQCKSVLLGLAQACAGLKCYDSAVVYLRFAHKNWPRDLKVNRLCGRVLGKVGLIDEAVGCWHQIKERIPGDAEALAEMSRLTTKKVFG